MSTYYERRMQVLQARIKARTKRDGTPLPGYEQNIASIRAEMEQLSMRQAVRDEQNDAE